MLNLLYDPIWTFAGSVLALIAIFVPFVVSALQKKKKRVSCKQILNTPLVRVNNEFQGNGNLKIYFKDKIVDKGYLLLIEFQNIGNVPIAQKDYETPLVIKFNKAVEVLNAEVVKISPKDISPEIEILKSKIKINPLLLNPSDKFMIKAIVNQFDDNFSVSGRIVGVKVISTLSHQSKRRNDKYYLYWGIGLILINSFIPKFEFSIIEGMYHNSLVIRGILITLGAVIFFYGLMPVNYWQNFIDKRKPRKYKNISDT